MNDNLFIFNSFLSGYVKFGEKNDPFLLRPGVSEIKDRKYEDLFSVTPEERVEYIVLINFLA